MRSLACSQCPVTNELVRAMYRVFGVFLAFVCAVALLVASNETFARSGAVHAGGFASAHAMSRAPFAHALRHHRRFNNGGFFWPGDFSNGATPYSEPVTAPATTISNEFSYTCTYDIPWDWAHRCPPAVVPSERAYAPKCPAETVTFEGRDGREQSVNIIRCY